MYAIMSEKKRFDSGAIKRKRQKDNSRKHEEGLSKTPTLFDLGFKHTTATEHQTEKTTTPSSDGNMEKALEVQVVPDDVSASEVDVAHHLKNDLGSEYQDGIGLWTNSNIT